MLQDIVVHWLNFPVSRGAVFIALIQGAQSQNSKIKSEETKDIVLCHTMVSKFRYILNHLGMDHKHRSV